LPWGRLAWTFSAITIIGSVPFTFAGAGVREIAALTFLGLYGVPPGECVAASLLVLLQKVAWAGAGAFVLWREETLRDRRTGQPAPTSISIIIPTLNDAISLPETVRRAQVLPEVRELIVVDGGSRDGTQTMAKQLGCRVLSNGSARGGQMRLGAAQATGDVVMFVQADTWLPAQAGHAALNCLRDETVVAGGFWKKSSKTPVFLPGSRWKCAVRLLVGRRIARDQALFMRRQILEQVGGVPDEPARENVELCRRLRKVGRLALADATIPPTR
jgi:cellulose synthase/poly-beta-1,6-N-acetylglucosamine synthase-like glycosyltransferase